MLHHQKGDLLKSDCHIIAHQANCFKTMGSGIAKSIREIYPEAYEADCKLELSPEERFGKYSYAVSKDKKRIIFNLYGQYHYGKGQVQTQYDKLRSALEGMFKFVTKLEKKMGKSIKIGLPFKMGCDRAGGDWNRVMEILEEMTASFKIDIYIYEYNPSRR